jgi:hypothetical protein
MSDRPAFTDQFLYCWLDPCGPASDQPPKRPFEYEEGVVTMARERKNWRDLCKSALGAKDPDELLKILQELKQALKSEEQVRRDFREAMRTISPG